MPSLRFFVWWIVFVWTGTTAAQDRPNILWITTEDMSAALGSYGDPYAVTPNLDRFAARAVRYTNAFASSPICAPARSTLITGVHATSLGTQHLRSEIELPKFVGTLPEYLREAGYYTTNNSKTDYNFSAEGRWDESSQEAHWRNRPDGAPFFSVINFMTTHEGPINNDDDTLLEGLDDRHDPHLAELPPYYPDTPEMRRIWARMYDLVTVMDAQVDAILGQLEEDGLADETIVFFFSDHGHGLPRYKRWAYRTGYHVPLIIYAPSKYRHLLPADPGTRTDDIVSFVDFAPTVLNLAGIDPPSHMQGRTFLGAERDDPRAYFVGARSRADDVYDVARTIIDERYVYIRNYMPHKPYIEEALIFGDQKASLAELHRVRAAGQLPDAGESMYEPKPHEELYDLQNDPYELYNLAGSPGTARIIETMRTRLDAWILETRDAGFLNEGEMMLRAADSTPYEMAQNETGYDLPRIKEAAERVGDPSTPRAAVVSGLAHSDSGVRFWSAVALQADGEVSESARDALEHNLYDPSPAVSIVSAETLCAISSHCDMSRSVLMTHLRDEDRPWLALQAAISMRRLGAEACPVQEEVQEVLRTHRGDIWGRYKNWMYSMFIGFALDQVLLTCGVTAENPIAD